VTTVAVALDAGGSKIAGGLVTPGGEVSTERRVATEGDGVEQTAALARDLAAAALARGLEVAGVGAGFPEYVDPAGRLTSDEVLNWSAQPRDLLAAAVPGAPVRVESDVRCGALAEAQLGAGRGLDSLLYVTLGTGLSSSLVIDGHPHAGHRGEAIALGELAADVPGWPGNLEDHCSGRGVCERYEALTGVRVDEARTLMQLAAGGDDVAVALLESAGVSLGSAIGDLVAVLDPQAVVLGGGLGSAAGPLRDALDRAYGARAERRPSPPPVVTARLGPRAGLVGAGLLVFH
jgi:glucokinase